MTKAATETSRTLRGGAYLAVAIGVMNVLTYAYQVVAAHSIGKAPYGAFSALMGLLMVISVLSLGLQATGARRISAAPDQVVAIERMVLTVGFRSAAALSALCLVLAPVMDRALHLESLPTALLVGVTAFPLTFMGAQIGVLQGEERWEPLAVVYLSQGVGRVGLGVVFMAVAPSEFAAMAGVTVGAWLPVLIGWLVLRRPRVDVPHSEGHPGLELLKEVGHSSQALLAFFALSNVDIIVARATMSDSQAGLYAAGLIVVKALLFMPQFLVVLAFPSMSKGASRRTLALAMGLSAGLGAVGVLAILLLPDLALVFVGGDEFAAVADDLWKFAAVGTLLSMVQLLVYSALARQQARASLTIWTALVVLVGLALTVSAATSLVLLVVLVDAAVFAILFVLALSAGRPAPAYQDAPAG